MKAAGRVSYHDNMKNLHILTITNLTENDSAEYTFRLQKDESRWTQSDFPVTLVVTGVKVDFSPSAVVTEGQRVTLTCSTSCPLTDDTNYIWYLNSRPLTLPQNQSKHLLLDPVSRQHAGNYSCAVKTLQIISSHENTLTVQSVAGNWTAAAAAAAAGVGAALLVLTTSAVFRWIRREKTSSQSPRSEASEQPNPDATYENMSAPSAQQDDHHYCRLHFSENHTDDLYSTIQPKPSD
uniref:sialoadhesin-like isoform X2 n=1 Tax=Scatophagus argus TaxID=75038 RepID=UPI001ED816BD|nr:sialoadhesin-like isoform X2 [Scatophagus argus]XP_046228758.1 sialoadhesin-like isoform X2 [Scatophagus argus]